MTVKCQKMVCSVCRTLLVRITIGYHIRHGAHRDIQMLRASQWVALLLPAIAITLYNAPAVAQSLSPTGWPEWDSTNQVLFFSRSSPGSVVRADGGSWLLMILIAARNSGWHATNAVIFCGSGLCVVCGSGSDAARLSKKACGVLNGNTGRSIIAVRHSSPSGNVNCSPSFSHSSPILERFCFTR